MEEASLSWAAREPSHRPLLTPSSRRRPARGLAGQALKWRRGRRACAWTWTSRQEREGKEQHKASLDSPPLRKEVKRQ